MTIKDAFLKAFDKILISKTISLLRTLNNAKAESIEDTIDLFRRITSQDKSCEL